MESFKSYEEALEWMTEQVDDPYQDNERFAFIDDKGALEKYDKSYSDGCCGFFDEEILVDGRRAKIGCNFGH